MCFKPNEKKGRVGDLASKKEFRLHQIALSVPTETPWLPANQRPWLLRTESRPPGIIESRAGSEEPIHSETD